VCKCTPDTLRLQLQGNVHIQFVMHSLQDITQKLTSSYVATADSNVLNHCIIFQALHRFTIQCVCAMLYSTIPSIH
jgi:phage terminase large subunit-like protein